MCVHTRTRHLVALEATGPGMSCDADGLYRHYSGLDRRV